MVRANDIQDKLLHLIGWEQNYDTSDLKISDALTASESGLYFQQIHPLLTLQNMACIAPDFKNITFPEYSPSTRYEVGNVVKYGDKLYKAKSPNLGKWPATHNLIKNTSFEYWRMLSDDEIGFGGINESVPLEFGGSQFSSNTADGKAYTISSDAHSGNHALAVMAGKEKRISLRDYIVLNPGIYRFSVFAKFKRTTLKPSNMSDNDANAKYSSFKLGVCFFNFDSVNWEITREYAYGDGHILKEENDKDYAEFSYDFEVHSAAKVYPVIKIGQPGFLLDDISLIGLNSENKDEYWVETNPFSEWLESKTKASIQKAITRYCNEKIAQGTYKTLCENRTLFDGTGRLVDVVKNRKNLVGFEIIPVRAKGITTKINKIGLQFTEPGEYTLYLMHSSMDAPVKIIKLNKIRKNSTEWFSLNDVYLPYQSEGNDAGGSWYLCYFQSELPEGSQAIKKDKDWSKEPCNSCSRREYLAWMAWSKYIEVHPFFVNEELVEATDFNNDSEEQALHLWDVENNQYTYNNNYGLNLEITINCDITDFIIEQRMLFQDIIAKQVAVDMLREFAYNANVRTNRHSINASRPDILYEIDGDSSSMKKSGLSYQLDMAFKAIKLSTEGIDRVCLPCKNNGIKYRTV
nr:MAG TPA: hypothetical protein [Caudoviricetes sp.]